MVDVKEKTGLQVRVLGPIEVDRDGVGVSLGSPKQRAVLAVLLTEVRGSVGRDRIIEGVWGEEASEANRHSFHTYVSNLRAILGDVIVRAGDTYRLDIPSDQVDSRRFEETVEEARRLVATEPEGTATSLREALGWWKGLPFADLSDVPGLQAEIRRLEELRLEAVELRVDAELAAGAHGTLVAELEALAEEHPFRERFRAQHMLALYRSGRQSEALRAYRRTEEFLAGELGVEPSRELRDLELKILQQDDSLLGASDRVVTQRLAFLVTDIEGSTALWDSHPQGMADALAVHDRVLREAIEDAGGSLFKHTGDGVLAVFPDCMSAVAAAEAAQRTLQTADWGEVAELRVRMGIDVGEAEARGGDFYGPPLNRASRISAAGHGGQVLVSASANAEITSASPAGVQIRQLGEHRLKGLASPERIAQVVFVGLPADFPELRLDAEPALDDRVELLPLPGYELREQIGEGAFGVVYRAYQPSVGREVAIKVIRPELADHPSFVRRFEAEARTVARLAHPHIVPLIDFWREPAGAYLVLQLLPGGSLQSRLADDIDLVTARRVLGHVGAALDHAHSQAMVHGDLKPANVMLDRSGNAYLSDFGIVTRLLDPDLAMSLSSAPEFRAPEEAETGPSPATDLFALGVMAGRLLDGTAEVEPVLARATASTPEDRYRSAAEFLVELDKALGEAPEEPDRPAVSRNPYKGLRAFDEADAADFYGRDELIATLLAAVSERRFVTVVGPSGSGKSSVVRAGLLPALARGAVDGSQQWFRVDMTPGPDPMAALSDAMEAIATGAVDHAQLIEVGLRGLVDGEMLVAIDQFEELYTQLDSPEDRRTFIDLIASAVEDGGGRVRVVATLRADFYDRPLEDERLGRLVRDGLVTVLPPTREELVEMITAPAQAVGLRWEPGLDHRIAEDVAHQPGSLPLLQYALTELVERRSGDLLTDNDYINVGGVAGALATRAEAVYQNLTPVQQETARQILLRLVTVDEDTDDTRRRVRRTELESIGIPRADLALVLDKFIGDRLLLADRDPTTRGPTVEVAHEALLREWPRLAGWVDDQREALILGRRFRAALADWETNDRHDDHLLTGHRLAPFIGWAETASLTADEKTYYQVSTSKDAAERHARRRRRRTLTGVLAGAAVVATILGTIAAVQANRATTEAEAAQAERDRALTAERIAEENEQRAEAEASIARRAEQVAFSRELAASAVSVLDTDPELSVLLGLQALEIAPDDDVLPIRFFTAFRMAIHGSRTLLDWTWEEESWEGDGELSPDGNHLAVTASPGAVEVWDARNGDVLWRRSTDDQSGWFWNPHFSPDGSTLAVAYTRYWSEERRVEGGQEAGIYLLSADSGDIIDVLSSPTECEWVGLPFQSAFTRDGEQLVRLIDLSEEGTESDCFDGSLAVEFVDLETGQVINRFGASGVPHEEFPIFVLTGIDSTGTVVVVSDEGGDRASTKGFDTDTGDLIWEAEAAAVGFLSPDGSVIALAIQGPAQLTIDLLDPLTGEVMNEVSEDASFASSISFSSEGSRLYIGRADGPITVWDTASGIQVMTVASPSRFYSISLDRDASILAGIGLEGVRTFDMTKLSQGEVMAYDFSPNQTASRAVAAAGGRVAVGGFHGVCPEQYITAVLLDASTGRLLHQSYDLGGNTLAITPDGEGLIQARSDPDDRDVPCTEKTIGSIIVKDTVSGRIVGEFEGFCAFPNDDNPLPPECQDPPLRPYAEFVLGMSVTPDGRLAAAGGVSGAFSVWEVETGRILTTHKLAEGWFEGCCGMVGVALHPDGSMVAVTTTQPSSPFVVLDLDGNVIHEEQLRGDSVQFSPDGSVLAAGHAEGLLRVFNTEDWSVAWEPEAHQGPVGDLDISPNSRWIVTSGFDGLVRVWDLSSRTLAHEIDLGNDFAKAVAFVDDQHIAIGTQDGLVAVLTLDPNELADIARSRVSRTLTEQECQTYLHDTCASVGTEP